MLEIIRTSGPYHRLKKVSNKFGSMLNKHYLCGRFKCRWSFSPLVIVFNILVNNLF